VLRFLKYQAAQNDFLVVPSAQLDGLDAPSLARALCDRRRGAGADGLLVVTPGTDSWRIAVINADGSAAETSGNGLRCAARYLLDKGEDPAGLTLDTVAGRSQVRVHDDAISINMGPPRFVDPTLPPGDSSTTRVPVQVGNRALQGTAVSMGNPHLVIALDAGDDLVSFPLRTAAATASQTFPGGVNVEVLRWVGSATVEARVWERGVGETRACGSGACAVAAALAQQGADAPLRIRMPGGMLVVEWEGDLPGDLWLTGPVEHVYEGRTSLRGRSDP